MTVWTMIFLIFVVILGLLAWLGWAAAQGNILAMAVVITVGVLLIFSIFKGFDILGDYLRDKAERKRFMDNTQENIAVLHGAFKTQNQALMGANRVAGLLNGRSEKPTIDLDPSMFNDVDEM